MLVVGSSVGYYVRPPASRPGEAAFDELLEGALRTRGIDATVRNDSRWFDTIVDANRRLPVLLTWFRPHVVIVLYGYIESQPLVCPRWFAKWLFTARPRTGRIAQRVRTVVGPPASRWFHRLAPRIARVPGLPSRVSPGRVRAELGRAILLARKERRSVVLCANVPDASDRIEATLPTTRARISATCDAIAGAVADSDDGAALIDLRALVADGGPSALLPDGIHLSAPGHQRLADHLVEAIARRSVER